MNNDACTSRVPALPPGDEPPWNTAQTALYLGYSVSEVRKLERTGRLPALPRHCNRLRFEPKVVRAFRDGTLNVESLRRNRAG